MAMMAITTNSSMSVKPRGCVGKWSLFFARDGRSATFTSLPGGTEAEIYRKDPRLRKPLTVERPEGRAPAEITVAALNTYRMGEGESPSVGWGIQPLWKLRETGLAVPSPVGRERVRVRVVFFDMRLCFGICLCTNAEVSDFEVFIEFSISEAS